MTTDFLYGTSESTLLDVGANIDHTKPVTVESMYVTQENPSYAGIESQFLAPRGPLTLHQKISCTTPSGDLLILDLESTIAPPLWLEHGFEKSPHNTITVRTEA